MLQVDDSLTKAAVAGDRAAMRGLLRRHDPHLRRHSAGTNGLCNWCMETGLLASNPLESIAFCAFGGHTPYLCQRRGRS